MNVRFEKFKRSVPCVVYNYWDKPFEGRILERNYLDTRYQVHLTYTIEPLGVTVHGGQRLTLPSAQVRVGWMTHYGHQGKGLIK